MCLNIWLLQIGEALPIDDDARMIRTAYLADELVKRGNNILWWASAFDHFQKKWLCNKDSEIVINEKYKIIPLKGIGYKKNISIARFVDHRLIAFKFKKMAPKLPKPDIIIASFPSYDLAYEAVKYAQKYDIPIIIDIRDQWPDIFLDRVHVMIKPVLRLLLKREYMMVRHSLMGAAGITSMMDLILDWGLSYAKRERRWSDKVFYLGYKAKSVSTQNQIKSKHFHFLKKLDNKFVVTFIGTFAQYHNPSILVECATKFKHNPKIHFVLAGDGQHMAKITNAASKLPNLTLTGWLNQMEITELLNHSNIGICTTPQDAYFFPNKAFAYMSAGLPVISAFKGDLKKLIEKYKFGYYYPPNNVDILCKLIENLATNSKIYNTMSQNAIKIYNDNFNADRIYKEYADYITDIQRKHIRLKCENR